MSPRYIGADTGNSGGPVWLEKEGTGGRLGELAGTEHQEMMGGKHLSLEHMAGGSARYVGPALDLANAFSGSQAVERASAFRMPEHDRVMCADEFLFVTSSIRYQLRQDCVLPHSR